MPTATSFWFNLLGFQAAWWACALYGNTGAWLALAWLLAHLMLQQQRLAELRIVLACAAAGWLVDTTLSAIGWLQWPGSPWLLPFWLYVLWACFAATLNHSMRLLQQHWLLAALLGAVGGPMSYYAGTQFGRLAFPSTQTTLLVLAATWAMLLPALLTLARRLSSPDLTTRRIA